MAKKPSPLKGRKLSQATIDKMVKGRKEANKRKAAERAAKEEATGAFIPGDMIPKRRASHRSGTRRQAHAIAEGERAMWLQLIAALVAELRK